MLITAATGSVGLAAIGLVNLLGGRPIAVTRCADKLQLLKDHGAAEVVVAEGQELTRQVLELTDRKGARVAFDPVAGDMLSGVAASDKRMLRPAWLPMQRRHLQASQSKEYRRHAWTQRRQGPATAGVISVAKN